MTTTTTVERTNDTNTVVTTFELPTASTFPMPSPVTDKMNTAASVEDLYER